MEKERFLISLFNKNGVKVNTYVANTLEDAECFAIAHVKAGKDDIAKANFALKLFNAPGEIEITDIEKQYIEAVLVNAKYWLADAIEKELNK